MVVVATALSLWARLLELVWMPHAIALAVCIVCGPQEGLHKNQKEKLLQQMTGLKEAVLKLLVVILSVLAWPPVWRHLKHQLQ
jgi:hypothetical protein